jgi:hypothetical protein
MLLFSFIQVDIQNNSGSLDNCSTHYANLAVQVSLTLRQTDGLVINARDSIHATRQSGAVFTTVNFLRNL